MAGVTVNWTDCDAPAFRKTLWKPCSVATGRLMEAVTSCKYSCTTVAPSLSPSLVNVTVAVRLPAGANCVVDNVTGDKVKWV